MENGYFVPADILLPESALLEKWSVIACDQFSSERDYWERVRETVSGAPSTLSLIIPEVYLGEPLEDRTRNIYEAMEEYTRSGILKEYANSFVYVERTLQDGSIRRGLIGAADLEEYEFSGENAAILASEGTAMERLPARILVRREAKLELPHIMSFIDDFGETVIEPLTEKSDKLPLLYDFELMEGGGRIRGMQVSGMDAQQVMDALRALRKKSGACIVIGDGNHSLAAAKVFWDELKQGLSEEEREKHPARRALLEINNVYEKTIIFEAIHRMIFNVDAVDFIAKLEKATPAGKDYSFEWHTYGKSGTFGVSASCIGDALMLMREFIDDYIEKNGCTIDYIHGAETVKRLSQFENRLGLILPAMDKSELFGTVSAKGVFPKKSFSVGRAEDKRYYLECRALRD